MLRGMPITFSAGAAQLGGGLIAIALIALLQPWATGQSRHLVWSAAALLLLAADLVAASWAANPTAEAWLAERPTVSGAALRDAGLDGRSFYLEADSYAVTFGRYLSFRDFGPRDTGYWFALRETLLPNMGILDGVASANNFDPLLSGRYADLLRMVNRAPGDERARLLQMMGVQVLISQVPEADFALVHANQNVTLAAVPDPFPRAYWIGSAEPVADAAAAAGSVADPSTDLRRVVVLEGAPPVSADQVARHELVPLEVEATNNRATVQAHAPVGGYVVLLDTYFPGWVAAVDGRPAPIYPANLAFRAVSVPAGQHMVEFTYRPFTVRAGAALSALCWLAVAGVVVLSRRPIAGRRNAEAGKTRPAGLTGQDAPGRMADLLRRVDDE
jgi:hypothetical protein